MNRSGKRTAGGIVGHAENGESIGAFNMEDVAILRVRNVHVVVAGGFLENLTRDCAGVGGGAAELRQHHRSATYQCV